VNGMTRGDKFFCKIVKADVHLSVCETGQRAVPEICADCDNARQQSAEGRGPGAMPHAPCAAPEAFCIGCGCSDRHACVTPVTGACFWIKVDRELGIGVCSEYPDRVDLFEAWQNHAHEKLTGGPRSDKGTRG